MTIQEAIESGRPFRRSASWATDDWFMITDDGKLIYIRTGAFSTLTKNDILADDWEVKP